MTRCRPAAPDDLRVTNVSEGRIDVSWSDNSDNEDGFRLRFRGRKSGLADEEGTVSRGRNETRASIGDLRGGFEYTITVSSFNLAGESRQSEEVHATTPATEETKDISLQRQIIIEGPIPYVAEFPLGISPSGRLLKVRNPGILNLQIHFVKRFHTTAECNNPSAVVNLSGNQTTTSQQMIELFGVAEPRFAAGSPIRFVACVATTQPNVDLVPIEITIIFD
jgi:hypothetical protein